MLIIFWWGGGVGEGFKKKHQKYDERLLKPYPLMPLLSPWCRTLKDNECSVINLKYFFFFVLTYFEFVAPFGNNQVDHGANVSKKRHWSASKCGGCETSLSLEMLDLSLFVSTLGIKTALQYLLKSITIGRPK